MTGKQENSANDASRGLAALLLAFTTWGVIPLYLRLLHPVPPLQIIGYRLLFCCFFVVTYLKLKGSTEQLRKALSDRSVRNRLAGSTALLTANWLTLVWAVNSGHVLESSLGFFINPIVSVLLGVLVLSERLRPLQWLAVAVAASGVAYIAWTTNAPPWIALLLAFTFGGYGLLRKTVAVDALVGLGAESLLAAPFALGYLTYCEWTGVGAFQQASAVTLWLLFAGGLITAIPLWLFSYGARRVPLSTVGIVQYIGPTLQLLIGLYVFHEELAPARLVGFAFVWTAVCLYAVDGLLPRTVPATAARKSAA